LTKEKTIQTLRHNIDEVDEKILELLNQRASLVMKVGEVKKAEKRDFHVPNREREIYERLTAKNSGPFPNEGLKRVFRDESHLYPHGRHATLRSFSGTRSPEIHTGSF
jgi:chorismate mutase/prephenate dehydratase